MSWRDKSRRISPVRSQGQRFTLRFYIPQLGRSTVEPASVFSVCFQTYLLVARLVKLLGKSSKCTFKPDFLLLIIWEDIIGLAPETTDLQDFSKYNRSEDLKDLSRYDKSRDTIWGRHSESKDALVWKKETSTNQGATLQIVWGFNV